MQQEFDKKIGFIGCGHMASAIIKGVISANLCCADNVFASALHEKSICGVKCGTNNIELAKNSDIIFLCVRPNDIFAVCEEIKNFVKDDAIIVSVAAFVTLEDIRKFFGCDIKIVRAMPNGPIAVGEGMTALCGDVTGDIKTIFDCCGRCKVISEDLFDAAIAVSGSSPAYVYMFLDSMISKACEFGMDYDDAVVFAVQAVLGSAKVVQECDKSTSQLIDEICTPGGTTIEAVKELKNQGFDNAIKAGMQACYDKSSSRIS